MCVFKAPRTYTPALSASWSPHSGHSRGFYWHPAVGCGNIPSRGFCAAAAALWRSCAHSGSEIHASTCSPMQSCKPSDAALLPPQFLILWRHPHGQAASWLASSARSRGLPCDSEPTKNAPWALMPSSLPTSTGRQAARTLAVLGRDRSDRCAVLCYLLARIRADARKRSRVSSVRRLLWRAEAATGAAHLDKVPAWGALSFECSAQRIT